MAEHGKSGVFRKVTLGLFLVVLGGAIAAPAVAAPPIGALKQFRIPTANSDPSSITLGSDGNYWFTESDSQAPNNLAPKQVGRITPAGVVTEFPVCNTCDNLSDIIQGPNNILYVTSNNRGLDEISTTNGAFLGHVEPNTGTALAGNLTRAGDDIYFNDFNDNSIWRFNVVTQSFTEFPLPAAASTPVDVTASGGFVYFAINNISGAIGKLDPSNGAVTEFPTDSGNPTFSVATATDGTIWFTERFNGMVGKLDPGTGAVTEFATSSTVSQPASIAPGPGGTMWFTQFNVGNVARITPAGTITEGKTLKGSGPEGVVVSLDGMQIWYTLFNNNKIAMLSLR